MIKTIGITLAVGEAWEAIAVPMIKHWSYLHGGLPWKVLVASDVAPFNDQHTKQRPSWVKPHLLDLFPDYDRIVFLDADTFTVRPWLDLVQDDVDLAIALDPPEVKRQSAYPERKEFRADWYFNNGVFVMNRSEITERLMKLWWELRQRRWPLFVDQDAMNRAIHDLGNKLRVQVLPQTCNTLMQHEKPAPSEKHVLHWAGVPNHIRLPQMYAMSLAVDYFTDAR
jgi:lipopolysaccharide biosynthesis glycosyltransferase